MRFSDGFKLNRFKAHYRDLYPMVVPEGGMEFIRTCLSNVLDVKKPVLVVCPTDLMRPSFAYLFSRIGFVDYRLMSAYSLIDIFLGNNEEEKTVLDISPDVVCLYLGYGEFENKRQADVIIQLVNALMMEGKTLWLYAKFSESTFKSMYPELWSLFKSVGTVVVNNMGSQSLEEL